MAIAIYNKENIIIEIRPDSMVNWIEPFDEESERFIEWNLPEGKEPPKYIVFPDEDMDVYSPMVGNYAIQPDEYGNMNLPAKEVVPTNFKTAADVIKQVDDHIESLLEAKAKELGYSNFQHTAVYINSPVQKYKDEANSIADWAAAMYQYAENLLSTLTEQQVIDYDFDVFINNLPDFNDQQ